MSQENKKEQSDLFNFDDFDEIFNLSDLDIDLGISSNLPETSEKDKHKVKQFLESINIRTEKLKPQFLQLINNAAEQLTLPPRGSQIRIRTQQSINLIAIIIKIIEKHQIIDELTIATYTLNRPAWGVLQDLLATGRIKALNLLLASAYTFRDKEYYQEFKNIGPILADKYPFHLAFAWSHFKITLVKCGGDFYQFEGSMNYSENNMAEQLLFENNPESYEYDYKFITEIMLNTKQAAIEIIC